jgi:hypothetical protein
MRTDAFMAQYGDAIDDRVAEIAEVVIDEVVAARCRRRGWLPYVLLTAVVGLTILLRQTPLAVGAIWAAAAVWALVDR